MWALIYFPRSRIFTWIHQLQFKWDDSPSITRNWETKALRRMLYINILYKFRPESILLLVYEKTKGHFKLFIIKLFIKNILFNYASDVDIFIRSWVMRDKRKVHTYSEIFLINRDAKYRRKEEKYLGFSLLKNISSHIFISIVDRPS